MNTLNIIIKKRDGQKLCRDEIAYLVHQYATGKIEDYQFSAFLMAAWLNGLDVDETFWLTESMLHSGETITFPKSLHPIYDKHSTGGVGDKISLTLTPLLAAMNVRIAMLSGRGLGHTGGTLDKLEAIPGLNPFWTKSQIQSRLKKCGQAISGQTSKIAPADKKIYALRDLTGTVESIPLITASILSKKLALDTDGIVFDIKVGSGAFMKTRRDGIKLARSLLGVCKKFERKAICILTDMSEPTGNYIGNYLEIMEVVRFIQTGHPADIRQITFKLAYEVLKFDNPGLKLAEVSGGFADAIKSGRILQKFKEFVAISGGNPGIFANPEKYFRPKITGNLKVHTNGYLQALDTQAIGQAALELGAGRRRLTDKIDPMAGIIIKHKIGSAIKTGETLFKLYGSDSEKAKTARAILADCYKISKEKIASPRKIITLIKS